MIVKVLDLVSEEIIVYRGVKSLIVKTNELKEVFYFLKFLTKTDSFSAKHYWIFEVRQ